MASEYKFLYVPDTACPGRVLTVARRIVNDTVEFTYCCNKATRAPVAYRHDNYIPRWDIHDAFDKALARQITVQRFAFPQRVFTIPYTKGEVITDILRCLSKKADKRIAPTVARIAYAALLAPIAETKLIRKKA